MAETLSPGLYNRKLGLAFYQDPELNEIYDVVRFDNNVLLKAFQSVRTGTWQDPITKETISYFGHINGNSDVRWHQTSAGNKDIITIYGKYDTQYPFMMSFQMPLYTDIFTSYADEYKNVPLTFSDSDYESKKQYFFATMAAIESYLKKLSPGTSKYVYNNITSAASFVNRYFYPDLDYGLGIRTWKPSTSEYNTYKARGYYGGTIPPPITKNGDCFSISLVWNFGELPAAKYTVPAGATATGETLSDTDPHIKDRNSLDTWQHQSLPIKATILFHDPSVISSANVKTGTLALFQEYTDRQNAANTPVTTPPVEDPKVIVSQVQDEEALKYHSGLEYFIRSIQLYGLTKYLDNNNLLKVLEVNLTDDEFIIKAFENGVFSPIIQDLLYDPKKFADFSLDANTDHLKLMHSYASYGFNHNLMGTSDNKLRVPQVDFKELFKAWAVPYKLSTGIISQTEVNYPIYIKLGLLIMIINHMCTIYDSEEGDVVEPDKQTPLLYIDFNPETNICLSEPLHMSIDVLKFLVPLRATDSEYLSLFDSSIVARDTTGGKWVGEGSEDHPAEKLFLPNSMDFLSGQLPAFKDATDAEGAAYRGKIMNVLVSTDYILNLCQNFASNNESQAVYLKPFLQQLITDLNKSLGDINIFRLAYSDMGNCLHIVDDQMCPKDPGEEYLKPNIATCELPLFGAYSIAKSLQINTEVSSRLANMIAISANSDQNSDSGKDGSPFGHMNKNFTDRYKPQALSIGASAGYTPEQLKALGKAEENKKTKKNAAEVASAGMLNSFVTSILSSNSPALDSIPSALNYYIERMNKRKSQNPGTKSSAMIPVSVQFKTDGISGLAMGHAFTIPDSLLPNTYSNSFARDKEKKETSRIGFVVIGLNNSLQNNLWETDIKANMIFLKDSNDFLPVGYFTAGLPEGEFSNTSTNSDSYSGTPSGPGSTDYIAALAKLPDAETFKAEIEKLATEYNTKAEYFYRIMFAESGIRPEIENSIGATGLIQFMPSTAAGLGTTTTALKQMSATEQSVYVKKYFNNSNLPKGATIYDMYAVVFFPVMVPHLTDNSWVIQTSKLSAEKISSQNPGIARAAGKKAGDPLNIGDFKQYVNSIA